MAQLLYKDLPIPQAWKPLFQEFQRQGWELETVLEAAPDWTNWPVLVLVEPGGYPDERRYLYFLEEPEWCGNTEARRGFTTASLRRFPARERARVEEFGLSLTTNWEEEMVWWVPSILDLCACESQPADENPVT